LTRDAVVDPTGTVNVPLTVRDPFIHTPTENGSAAGVGYDKLLNVSVLVLAVMTNAKNTELVLV
jgi:hypothetical protein